MEALTWPNLPTAKPPKRESIMLTMPRKVIGNQPMTPSARKVRQRSLQADYIQEILELRRAVVALLNTHDPREQVLICVKHKDVITRAVKTVSGIRL